MIKLTPEQTKQAESNPDGVECQGEGTDKTFVIVDAKVLEKMKRALYQQEVNESIANGISDMEAGRMMTVDEADDRVRAAMGFPSRPAS